MSQLVISVSRHFYNKFYKTSTDMSW